MATRPILFVGIAVVIGAACSTPPPTVPSPTPTPTPTMTPSPTPTPTPTPDPEARYVVTFQSTWSAATHPDDWPSNAHYSGLIGGTHSNRVTFWQEGQLASPGIEAMAEQGRKTPLDQEVGAAIAASHAEFLLSGNGLGDSPGTVSLDFSIRVNFPLVTLVTMVAPSPDWFVGVTGLPLLVNNQWRDEVVVALYPWDAGTDSGLTYDAENQSTVPHQPVHRLLGFPVSVNGNVAPFGTMTFRRQKSQPRQRPATREARRSFISVPESSPRTNSRR